MSRCDNCLHFCPYEAPGWVGDLFYDEGENPSCHKKPGMANLKSFPFKDTKCPEFRTTFSALDPTPPTEGNDK